MAQREGFLWAVPATLMELMLEWEGLARRSDRVLWSLSPYALVWTLWNERNAVTFNQKPSNAVDLWDLHLNRIAWWVQSHTNSCPYEVSQFLRDFTSIKLSSCKEKRRIISWSPPVSGLFKLNVDGAARGSPGPMGIGGILRNHRKEIMGYFSKNMRIGFAYEAEVLAMYHGLLFCQQFLIRNMRVIHLYFPMEQKKKE